VLDVHIIYVHMLHCCLKLKYKTWRRTCCVHFKAYD